LDITAKHANEVPRNIRLGRASFETLLQSAFLLLLINILESCGISMLYVDSPLGIFRSSAEYGIAVTVIFLTSLFITNLVFSSSLSRAGRAIKIHLKASILESCFYFLVFFALIYVLGTVELLAFTIEGIFSFIGSAFLVLCSTNFAYSRLVEQETMEERKNANWYKLGS